MANFPFCAHTAERDIFFDRPAFEHLIRQHSLNNSPAKRQFRGAFENALGAACILQAVKYAERKEGSLAPAARNLLELLVSDTTHWVSYRRETDTGEYLDRRLNIFLACGLIIVVQIEHGDWYLRSAYFTSERNKALEDRCLAIRHVIRNQIGKMVDGYIEFDPEYRYRSKSNVGYTVQTDFQLSDPNLFGVTPMANRSQRWYFDLNAVQG